MGYKTSDPKEVTELQKQGKAVIGLSGTPLVYEFNFTKEVVAEKIEVTTTAAVKPAVLDVKPPLKKRGRKPKNVSKNA